MENLFQTPKLLSNETVNWDKYYLNIAKAVAIKSTCLRRKYGAVIVSKDNRIVSCGYNGAAQGRENCLSKNHCYRESLNVPHGERYELCVAVHAEANAIIKANRMDLLDSTIYIYGFDSNGGIFGRPCLMCTRTITNAGIKNVVFIEYDESQGSYKILKKSIDELY